MAWTTTTHKIAQSVSGQTFVVYTDATNVIQAVLPLQGTFTNLLTTGTISGSSFLFRIVLNQPATGTITVTGGGSALAIIAAGTPAQSFEYGCVTGGDLVITCTSAENITVVWA